MKKRKECGRPTRIKYDGAFQVSVLLRAQIQTPELLQTRFKSLHAAQGGLLAIRVVRLRAVEEDLFEHAGRGSVVDVEADPVLSQTQDEERRPAVLQQRQLIFGRQLLKRRQTPHEMHGLDQHA